MSLVVSHSEMLSPTVLLMSRPTSVCPEMFASAADANVAFMLKVLGSLP